jgi:hypothetical protein
MSSPTFLALSSSLFLKRSPCSRATTEEIKDSRPSCRRRRRPHPELQDRNPNQTKSKTNSCSPPSIPCITRENGEEPVTNKKDQEKLLPYTTALHISRKPKVWRITVDTTEKLGEVKITEKTETLKITQSITTERAKLSQKQKNNRNIITTHASLTNDFIKTLDTRVPRT